MNCSPLGTCSYVKPGSPPAVLNPLYQWESIGCSVGFSGQRRKIAAQHIKRFGNRGHPAADGMIGVDYIAVEPHLEDAIMRLDQLRSHAEGVGRRFRQTGGGFKKTSLRTEANINNFRG
jgi:hypothetical protein